MDHPASVHPSSSDDPQTAPKSFRRASAGARLLVVEDEPKVADALREGLEVEQYQVVVERTGDGAFARATTEPFDLILLDLTLPDRDGIDLLTELRRRGTTTPVLVLTARDTIDWRVTGLNSGADDYLTKPFAFAEVVARIRALLRRGRVASDAPVCIGDLRVDRLSRRISRAGRPVDLTAREFELLDYLVRSEGQVVSREMLARDVWSETARSTTLNNVIDVHIARLRRKIDLDHLVKLIHTVRGIGFMLCEEAP